MKDNVHTRRQSSPPLVGASAEGRQRVGAFVGLPALLRQLGVDPAGTLESAGLPPDALESPDRDIAYAAVGRLLAEAASRGHCPHLGLLAGRMWHLQDFGLAGELARHSATLRDALQVFVVNQYLNSQGGLAFLNEGGGAVEFGYAIYQPGVVGAEYVYDTAIAAAFSLLHDLCGSGWRPSDVMLARARPADVAPWRNLLKATPRFNAEYSVLRFPDHWMGMPIAGADPAQLREAQRRADAAGEVGLVDQVRRSLRMLLMRGVHSGDSVAKALSMHRRTLNRRLQAEGTTFQRVLDEIRLEVARQLLAGTEIPLDDIAAALGYSSVSPFMRAFRRWTGATPGHWRHHVRTGAPPGA